MTFSHRLLFLCAILIAFALPAHANNPPQPDGLFSVLLIFPVVLLGTRLAGVVPKPRRLSTRIISGIAVAICAVFFLAAGTIVGMFAAILVLTYAVVRAVQIMQRGQSTRRALIGVVVMALSLFAIADYWESITGDFPSLATYEAAAIRRLRTLSDAESLASNPKASNAPSARFYSSIAELQRAHLIDESIVPGRVYKGYLYGEILDPDRKQFIFYARPAKAFKPELSWRRVVPGGSLLSPFLPSEDLQGTGERSFAVDETSVIRWAIRPLGTPVTREEVQRWSTL